MGSEGQQDIEMSILTALLKGGFCKQCTNWSWEDRPIRLSEVHSWCLSLWFIHLDSKNPNVFDLRFRIAWSIKFRLKVLCGFPHLKAWDENAATTITLIFQYILLKYVEFLVYINKARKKGGKIKRLPGFFQVSACAF